MKKLALILVALAVVAYGGITYAYNAKKPVTVQNTSKQTVITVSKYDDTNVTPQELLELVNKERAKKHVAPLRLDARLNESAQLKAEDMTKYNYFGHVSPHDGRHGYTYVSDYAPSTCMYESENLAQGEDGLLTTRLAVDWWKTSSAHYAAMVDAKYTLTGFGVSGKSIVEHFCQT